MKKHYLKTTFKKILIPVLSDSSYESVLAATRLVAGEGQVTLIGLVNVPEGSPLSAAAVSAREIRQKLKTLSQNEHVRVDVHVHASYNLWNELVSVVNEKRPDLLILVWPDDFNTIQIPNDALAHPPCDVAIFSGKIPTRPQNVLVSIRGGPYAELAIRMSDAISHSSHAKITSLHISTPGAVARADAPFRSLEKVLVHMPEIHRETVETSDPLAAIIDAACRYDLLIMGATARPENASSPLGPVAEAVLNNGKCGVIIVKTRRPAPLSFESEIVGGSAISVLVDKWFAENTFHANEFNDLKTLYALKERQNVSISLALPALNEEETIENVIQTVRKALMVDVPLLDEIVLIDSNSTDRTREIARDLGIPVYIHQEMLPQYGARRGKGEALWKSLLVTRGDIVLWIDTDIVNIQPHFVYGLIGPLLIRPEVQLVKGFYQRPLKVGDKLQAGSGGRVTELSARPMLNLFYPELSGLIQPLAGEYGGRRTALERVPFSSGYGVEIGLLIDMLEFFGINAIAQVDLEERIHHNQSLEALSKMSFTIMQTVFHKLERRFGHSLLDEENRAMKLIRYEPGRFFLDFEEINALERPPMLEIPVYKERRAQ
ncbi:MAG: glucosyl-3-phosphoglycerate synthase [Anaerolineae bacterium]|nr:glucosyl-3-phosphoglycerate synthase [Anaerolineae bacterium]